MGLSEKDILDLTDPRKRIRAPSVYYGLYFGIVEDNADPLTLGRVRARVEAIWPDPTTVPTRMLPWALVQAPRGGAPDSGLYEPLPVGAQVVVQFIQGEANYPVVTGCVWGAPDGSKATAESPSEVRDALVADPTKIHVQKTPGGHVELQDDNPLTQRVLLLTAGGNLALYDDVLHAITIRTAGGIVLKLDDLGGRASIVMPSGQHVWIDDNDATKLSIRIDGKADVRIDGDAKVRVGGKLDAQVAQNARVRAGGNVAVESGGDTKITAGGSIAIQSGGSVAIMAPGVVTVNGALIKLN